MGSARNPSWVRDELILALDLYFRGGRVPLLKGDQRVVELSELLRRLPTHPEGRRGEGFRNVNSVAMKVANFASIDPDYRKAGLSTGGKLDRVVWDDYATDPGRLTSTAAAIRKAAEGLHRVEDSKGDDQDDEFFEGRLLARLHKRRERRPDKVAQKKRAVLQRDGALKCEACSFDFEAVYGPLGAGFAECHHRTPLADLAPGQPLRLSDLAILCANCHRIIHRSGRRGAMLSVGGLADLLRQRGAGGH